MSDYRIGFPLFVSLCLHLLVLFVLSSPRASSVQHGGQRLLVFFQPPAASDQMSSKVSIHAEHLLVESKKMLPVISAAKPAALDENKQQVVAGRGVSSTAGSPLDEQASKYWSKGLDVAPHVRGGLDIEYPDHAGYLEGLVVLNLFLDDVGNVDDVILVRASPPGVFEEGAIKAVRQARFSPGVRLGFAVNSQLLIEINFSPTNRGAEVGGNRD